MARWTGRVVVMVAAVLLWPAAVSAGETIEYKYVAQGRLVKVLHTDSSTENQNVQACYTYDKAGNRVKVKTSTSSPTPPADCT